MAHKMIFKRWCFVLACWTPKWRRVLSWCISRIHAGCHLAQFCQCFHITKKIVSHPWTVINLTVKSWRAYCSMWWDSEQVPHPVCTASQCAAKPWSVLRFYFVCNVNRSALLDVFPNSTTCCTSSDDDLFTIRSMQAHGRSDPRGTSYIIVKCATFKQSYIV